MAKGDFVWCDLSTFHVEQTRDFYQRIFGWSYQATVQPDGSPYFIAATSEGPAAGVFEMPEKFQAIGLPSFWMSYIAVDDAARCADQAQGLGGKVEVGPLAYGEDGAIALIRDPLGAGFTVYQGDELTTRSPDAPGGHMAWNALYVSDAGAVAAFYQALFDWTIARHPHSDVDFTVHDARGNEVSAIHQVPDETRGKFQFWGVHFRTSDIDGAKREISESGGEILYEDRPDEGGAVLARDPDGAAFFLQPA